jgi:hypothetical protein
MSENNEVAIKEVLPAEVEADVKRLMKLSKMNLSPATEAEKEEALLQFNEYILYADDVPDDRLFRYCRIARGIMVAVLHQNGGGGIGNAT